MSTDPTLQTSGALLIILKNLTNVTLKLETVPPIYGPPASPPPEWARNKQYFSKNVDANMFGARYEEGSRPFLTGLYELLRVADMSSAQVMAAKLYYFSIECGALTEARMYFAISGGASGSTVLPGFGLRNLNTAPARWSYITPQAFNGEFTIGVNNTNFAEPLMLSVVYQPLRWFSRLGINSSRLVYTVAGGMLQNPWVSTEQAGEREAQLEIATASHPYDIVGDPGAAPEESAAG